MEQQRSSRSSIGPNWSRQPLGGVKKAEVKYPGHTSLNPSWIRSLTALLRIPLSWIHLLSLSPDKWTLSPAMCSGLQASLIPWWEEKPPSHLYILLLFDFSLFSFRWVRVLSCVCQRRQAQDSAKPANAHFNDSWTLSQSATSEKPFSAKDDKKGIL